MADRLRLSRARGWRLPAGAVNVARPGKWGNPFVVGRDGNRAECVHRFAALAVGFVGLADKATVEEQRAMHRRLRDEIGTLEGKDLACWCALDGKPCHGDVLLLLAAGSDPADVFARYALDDDVRAFVRLGVMADELDRIERNKFPTQETGHG